MSYTCLIIDLWFGRYIVDVTAATYQKAVLAVIQPFHASYAPGTVEVREAVDADPPSLFNCHSSYTHNPMFLMLLVSILFPFVKPRRASWPGKPFSVRSSTADKREDKTSVRLECADGIPKFPRHAEFCGRLPSSPPAESRGGTWRSSCPQYICTEKRLPDMTPNGLQLKRTGTGLTKSSGTAVNVGASQTVE